MQIKDIDRINKKEILYTGDNFKNNYYIFNFSKIIEIFANNLN